MKLSASPAELVVALDLDPQAQVVRARHLLGRVPEAANRGERRTGDDRAGGDGERDAARRHEHHQQREPVERAVDLLQRAEHLHREPLPERRREDADVNAVDRRVRQVPVARAAGDELRLPVDRDRDRRIGRAEDRAVRLDELDQGVAAALQPRGAKNRPKPGAVEGSLGRRRTVPQRVVDLAAKVAADDHVDDAAGDRDRRGDRHRDREGQPRAEAHRSGSRSA